MKPRWIECVAPKTEYECDIVCACNPNWVKLKWNAMKMTYACLLLKYVETREFK